MAKRKKGRPLDGIFLVDKPTGASSNNILQKVRWLYQAQKAGHTGALDPLATGMLPICFGEATKFSQFLLDTDKTYQVEATLGVRTDTSDSDGEAVQVRPVNVTEPQLLALITQFTGPQKQVPSMYSALKHNGQPLYKYARQGITIEREARDITVFSFTLDSFSGDKFVATVHCSKGTYIRSLVDDIGEALGCGAHVSMLRRVSVGPYPAEKMVTLAQLEQWITEQQCHEQGDFSAVDAWLLPMDSAVQHLQPVLLNDAQATLFGNGGQVKTDYSFAEQQLVRVYHQQQYLGVAETTLHGVVAPKRVVNYEAD